MADSKSTVANSKAAVAEAVATMNQTMATEADAVAEPMATESDSMTTEAVSEAGFCLRVGFGFGFRFSLSLCLGLRGRLGFALVDGVAVAVGEVAVASVETVSNDVAVDGVVPESKSMAEPDSVAVSDSVAVTVSDSVAMTDAMTAMYNFGDYSVPMSVMSVAVADANTVTDAQTMTNANAMTNPVPMTDTQA